MPTASDYSKKISSFSQQTLFEKLSHEQQDFIRRLAFAHRFTFQEFRQVVNACRDLDMWGEASLQDWWRAQAGQTYLQGAQLKKHLLQHLQAHLETLRNTPPAYHAEPLVRPKQREKHFLVTENSDKKIYGMCPVASEKTVCCNLRTIDAVENCIFGCSYCSIQTFYREQIIFDADFAAEIKIALFKTMYEAFAPWRECVFMYLCMEKAEIWEKTFGYVYRNNEEFEEEFGRQTLPKAFPLTEK